MTKTLTDKDLAKFTEFYDAWETGDVFADEFLEAVGYHIPAIIAMARQRNELLEVAEKIVSRADETLNGVPPKSAEKLRSGGDCGFSIGNEIIMEARAAIARAKGEAS